MLTGVPTGAQEHLHELPPDLQETIGRQVLSLSHESLHPVVNPTDGLDDWGDVSSRVYTDFEQRVPPEGLEAEQQGHSERVEQQMERAALFLRSAHQELESSGKEAPGHVVMDTAAQLALRTAEKAKQVGDEQTALEATETFLVIHGMGKAEGPTYNDGLQIVEAVDKNLSDTLIEAAHNLHGLVHIVPGKTRRQAKPVTAILDQKKNLLSLTSDLEFSDDFSHIAPLDRTRRSAEQVTADERKVDALSIDDLSSLAVVESKQRHNPRAAAEVGLKIVEKKGDTSDKPAFYDGVSRNEGGSKLALVGSLCKEADAQGNTGEFSHRFDQALAGFRDHRIPWSDYRDSGGSRYDVHLLDAAVVSLIRSGNTDIAKKLITASAAELSPTDTAPNGPLIAAIEEASFNNPEERQATIDVARELQIERAAELQSHLQAQGIPDIVIERMLDAYPQPDQLLAIDDPQFWQYRYKLNDGASEPHEQVFKAGALPEYHRLYRMLKDKGLDDWNIPIPLAVTQFGRQSTPQVLDIAQEICTDPQFESIFTTTEASGHGVDIVFASLLGALGGTDHPRACWELAKHAYGPRALQVLHDAGITTFAAVAEDYERAQDKADFLKTIEITASVFGEYISLAAVDTIRSLRSGDGRQAEALAAFGIKKTGQAGIDQLKNRLAAFTTGVFERGEIPAEQIIENPFLLTYLKSIVRFDASQWGSKSDEDLIRLLQAERENPHPLHEGYEVQDMRVAALDQEAVKDFELSKEAIRAWDIHARALQRALKVTNGSGSVNWGELGTMLTDIGAHATERTAQLDIGIERLSDRITQLQAEEKDTTKIEGKLQEQKEARDRLASIDYSVVDEFTIETLCDDIRELASHKEIVASGELQSLLIVAALLVSGRNQTWPDLPLGAHDQLGQPSLPDIQSMSEFIDHIVNKETWRDLFTTVGGRKQLNYILDAHALSDDIRRSKSIATSGTRAMRFIPSRGTLLELSGHTGDSCWASKYESIADEFPNITAITMVQNPGSASQRVAGSALLIETTSAEGEPLLVLRGINPIQNVITELSQQSFFESITGYAEGIAQRTGRKVAVVIDAESGGSATNRPGFFEFLESVKPNLTAVTLASEADTTFNGYNITDQTYLVG